ncbi:DoxX family protein [Tunturiibacter lichenicola]|uniref:DoxX family protein n=1 Tax=Tunturiibacter lichenicola TaxID=2051959 RepID=UPI0021B17E69|nr:DoxX family protein [Edaphobacter lichenicola]
METESDIRERRTACALLRIVVGVNLTMHGISRIISGPGEFAAKLVIQFTHAPLPAWSVWAFALILPSIEGILGFLILIGLRTRAALIAAGVLIAVLTFGTALVQDWNATGIQLTYAIVYAALLFLGRYNGWSIDSWIARNSERT